MADYTITNTFTNGTTADADEVNTNFTETATAINDRAPLKKLMHSGSGTTTAIDVGNEEELDTHTFSVNDFATTDAIRVVIQIYDASTGGVGGLKIRLDDSGAPATTNNILDAQAFNTFIGHFIQKSNDNTDIMSNVCRISAGGVVSNTAKEYGLTDANVIATAFTISLRGYVHTGGSLYWRWWVYKIDHE